MDRISNLRAFHKWVEELPPGEYVFRGVSNKSYEIEASTYRRLKNKDGTFRNKGDESPNRLLQINKEMIDVANLHRHGWKNDKPMSDLILLSELQHIGAATCLIDFTKNPQVALWMAARDSSKGPVDGKVYAVDISSHLIFKPVSVKDSESKFISDFFVLDEREGYQLYQWQPNYQNNRMRAQQSIFLFGGRPIKHSDECIIDKRHKKDIRISLSESAGITGDILFPDIEGFASQRAENKAYMDHDPSTESLINSYLERGRQASSEGKIDEAINCYTYGISMQPTNDLLYELYKERAILNYNRDEKDAVISDCDKITEINEEYSFAFYLRGRVNYDAGKYQTAIKDFSSATDLDPTNPLPYYWKGMAHFELEEYEAALPDFSKAYNLESTNPNYMYWLGRVKFHTKIYDEAIEEFDKVIATQSLMSTAYYWRGACNYVLDKYDQAIVDFDSLIAIDSDNPHGYFGRGLVYKKLSRITEAISDLEAAHALANLRSNIDLIEKIENAMPSLDR